MCLDKELNRILDELTDRAFDEDTASLACYAVVYRHCLDHVEPGAEPHPALLTLHAECVRSYAVQQGICVDRLSEAITALQRATEVYRYLRTIPD
jgi:hypothetical protein